MKNVILGAGISGIAMIGFVVGMSFMTKGFDQIGIGPYAGMKF